MVLGKVDLGNPIPVDPGSHVLAVTAPGRRPFRQEFRAVEGAPVRVLVPALEKDPAAAPAVAPATPPVAPPPLAPAPVTPAGDGLGGQKIAALVVGGLGVVGIGVGLGFGAAASGSWDDAEARCSGGALDRCDSEGIALGEDAASAATIATVGVVAGGALLVGGVVLWLTAPPPEERGAVGLGARIGPRGAAVVGSW